MVDGLVFSALNKAAGIDNEIIGLCRIKCQFVPLLMQLAQHHLGIYEILGTPKIDQSHLFPAAVACTFTNVLLRCPSC